MKQARQNDHRRNRDDHRRRLEERGDFRAHAGQIHVMRPDDERQEADGQHRIHERFIAPDRLARVVGDDFADDAHRRQNQNVNFRMAEEPKQMLPQQRTAAAADVRKLAAHRKAGRQKETRVRDVVHQLHDGGGFERRKRQQQQERRHELRPDKERQAHPGHARRAQLDDGGDEIHRAQQRGRDEENHADDPEQSGRGSESWSPAANRKSSPPAPRRPE